jgi:hypothetical protein
MKKKSSNRYSLAKLRYKIIVKNGKPAMWTELQKTISDYNTEVLKEKNGLSKRIVGFFSERGYVREYPTGNSGIFTYWLHQSRRRWRGRN